MSSAELSGLGDGFSPEGDGAGGPESLSGVQKLLKRGGWIFLFFFFLAIFSIAKIPDDRIRGYVQGQIDGFLGPHGITMTSEKSGLSLVFGPSYTFSGVKLILPDNQSPVSFDRITVSPAILPLLLGKMGGALEIKQGDGSIKASFAMKIPKGNAPPSSMDLAVKVRNLNLDKASFATLAFDLGAAQGALGADVSSGFQNSLRNGGGVIKGSSILSVDFSQSGDPSQPSALSLSLQADLTKIVIDAQPLMGFPIPKLSISEMHADIETERGRLVFKSFRLGKAGSSDDIKGTITGDIALGKSWDQSSANLRANFSLSDTLLSGPLSLLKMLLQQAEQSDKTYTYAFSGPLSGLQAQPVAK